MHVVHRILNTAKPTADLVGEGNTRNDARRPARGYLSVPVWEYAFIGNQIQTKKTNSHNLVNQLLPNIVFFSFLWQKGTPNK